MILESSVAFESSPLRPDRETHPGRNSAPRFLTESCSIRRRRVLDFMIGLLRF